ncbi:MAG: alpha-isopropylmalate synthase regulatory domain-containing protein [Caldilineaceae bacterium]
MRHHRPEPEPSGVGQALGPSCAAGAAGRIGLSPGREELNEVFQRFKEWQAKKRSPADIEALVADELYQPTETWELVGLQVQCGNGLIPTAAVTLRNNNTGEDTTQAVIGAGPVDAAYKGINQIIGIENTLVEFLVQAVTEGIDANGDVTVRIEVPQSRGFSQTAQGRARRRLFSGRGVDTDIIVASTKAYVQALNRMIAAGDGDSSAVAIMDTGATEPVA